MRKTHLKGFLIALAGFGLLITIISLIMPSKVVVSKTEMIHAPKETIMPYLADLNEWKKWHPSFMDTTISIEIRESADFQSAVWNSNHKQNVLRIIESSNEHIKFELVREGKKPIVNIIAISPMDEVGGNQISWDALTSLKWYPWEKFSGIFINDISGPGYEQALKNLKSLAQHQQP